MLEESQKEHSGVIDFLTDACKVLKEVEGIDGKTTLQLVLDTERTYWKTHNVASNRFGRSVLELKQYENCAIQAYNHMSAPRAAVLAKQILKGVEAYKYSIDAKSSESQRDKNNASMTLVDKLNKNKSEHVYQMKGDMNRSLKDAILGRQAESDSEND
jgi:hypothetical protein